MAPTAKPAVATIEIFDFMLIFNSFPLMQTILSTRSKLVIGLVKIAEFQGMRTLLPASCQIRRVSGI
jgi:ABC-type glycerol-3-phosphate transport system permease component